LELLKKNKVNKKFVIKVGSENFRNCVVLIKNFFGKKSDRLEKTIKNKKCNKLEGDISRECQLILVVFYGSKLLNKGEKLTSCSKLIRVL
jgi:hypothetical protein